MRQLMRATVLALIVLAVSPDTVHATEPLSRVVRHHGPCSGTMAVTRPDLRPALIERRVDRMIRCAFGRWSGDIARGLCTGDRESSDYPWARNASNHIGIFQHDGTYWKGRARTYLRKAWFPRMRRHHWYPPATNARANIIVSARMVKRGGWSPWSGGCIR